MAAKLSIFQKGLILILSPILLESIVVFALYSTLSQTDAQQALEAGYNERSSCIVKFNSLNFEACMILFMMGVPGSTMPRSVFDDKIGEVKEIGENASRLMNKDAYLAPLFKPINAVSLKVISSLEQIADTISSGSGTALISQVDDTIGGMIGMLSDTAGLIDKFVRYNDQRIELSRNKIEALRKQHLLILLAAASGNVVLSFSLIYYFNQSIRRRLGEISNNTELLRKGKELPPPPPGKDEIARLDLSFYAMQQALSDTRRKEGLLFENAADVICILNSNNEFKYVNPAAKPNWNRSPELLHGQNIESIIADEDRSFTLQQLSKCRESNAPSSFEVKVVANEDKCVEYHWSVYAEPIEKLLYCVAHDISAQKELERSRERYISIVGHDLRKPIASIAESFESICKISGLSEKAISKIEMVRNNIKRLLLLVEDLGKRQAFATNEQALECEWTTAGTLIERALANVEGLARSKKIALNWQAEDIKIEADLNKLIQVLVNLLSNAIKFSPESAQVSVNAKVEGDFVEISVIDRGRGIPDSQVGKVFEKFQQVNQEDGKRSAGTGLGLPICKQIVAQHNGIIGVKSKVDEGSTFWFRLPIRQLDQVAVLTPQSEPVEIKDSFGTSEQQFVKAFSAIVYWAGKLSTAA